ncbi:MAG: hypothetical protein J5725_11940 [Bacteroidales bacterium]|nr:hypothetical protein [Bacteroidales bacterium]
MYNILLDRLPTDYEGYLIRTSFRIGMQICLCLQDNEFTDEEKIETALTLLYGYGIPTNVELAVQGLEWFITCGIKQNTKTGQNKTLMYWDFDAQRIFSSFMATYGIDLSKEDMHWFKFISMLGSLGENTALSKAIEIRGYDLKDLKGKAKQDMINLKHSLTPPVEYTDEEKAVLEQFDSLFDTGGDVNG